MIRFIERIFRPLFRGMIRKKTKIFRKRRTFTQKIIKKVQLWFRQVMFTKDITLEYYIKIGRMYIAKKLVAIMILVSILMIYFLFINPPIFINDFFNRTSDIVAASKVAEAFSGRANYYDDEDGKLIYEGSMEDGQFSGNGKLYDDNGLVRYEGEFSGNEKHGQGKEYDEHGNLLYEGAFENGRRHGFGMFYRDDGSIEYEGTFDQGVREGSGTEYYTNGQVMYEGDFKNNQRYGTGELFDENNSLVYKGEFINGEYGNNGIEYFPGGEVKKYEGEFSSGLRHGFGRLNFSNGDVHYEGTFNSGKFSGDGTKYFENGEVHFEGEFHLDVFSGNGTQFNRDGVKVYEGDFYKGVFHGDGSQYSENGSIAYTGQFRGGVPMNIGTLFDDNEEELYRGYFRGGYIDIENFLGKNLARLEKFYDEPDFLIEDEDENETEEFVNDESNQLTVSISSILSLSNQDENDGQQRDNNESENDDNRENGVLEDEFPENDEIKEEEKEDDGILKNPATVVFNEQQMAFRIEPSKDFELDTFITKVEIWNRPLLAKLLEEGEEQHKNDAEFTVGYYTTANHVYIERYPFTIKFEMDGNLPTKAFIYHHCECQFDQGSIGGSNGEENGRIQK